MYKKIGLTIILIATLIISGCGNESSADLVDIEQFRCQDSIETVFDVLGETDIETSYGADYYKYTELNLWGYNGEAVFNIRDDGETIQKFYCYLTLSDKEFDEILTTFSDKYGSYTVSNYGDTIKTYEWEIAADQSESIGYSNIAIQDNGKNKYTVTFSDDMSYLKDEEYYKCLEEKNTDSSENDLEVIAEKEYDLGNGDSMNIAVFDKDGNTKFYFSANISDKNKAAIAFSYFYTVSAMDSMNEYISDISVLCDKKAVMYISGHVMGIGSDGVPTNTFPDWYTDSMDSLDQTIEDAGDFLEILNNNVTEFFSEYNF